MHVDEQQCAKALTPEDGGHSFASAAACSFTRTSVVRQPLGSVAVKREGATPPDVVDETSKREAAHGQELSNAEGRTSELGRWCTLQALVLGVTRALSETLSNFHGLVLELHEISCPGTTADGANGLSASIPIGRGLVSLPPLPKSTSQNATDLDRRFCTPSPSCTRRPFTAWGRYCRGFRGNARRVASPRVTTLAVKRAAITTSTRPILRTRSKCISVPCNRIVVPTLQLQRCLVQGLCCNTWPSTCHRTD